MTGRLIGLARSRNARQLALEALVVIFGVLVALLVDRWREDLALREEAAAATARLFTEVAQNLTEIRDTDAVVAERLRLLRAAHRVAPDQAALADLMSEFRGFRSPDLSDAAWQRLAVSELADSVDPELLAEAFYLYEWNEQFSSLDREIDRLVYGELFYLPERRATAVAISERIMAQQLTWAREAVPQYERFLERSLRDE